MDANDTATISNVLSIVTAIISIFAAVFMAGGGWFAFKAMVRRFNAFEESRIVKDKEILNEIEKLEKMVCSKNEQNEQRFDRIEEQVTAIETLQKIQSSNSKK